MASDNVDALTGAPIFLETGGMAQGADLTEVAAFAAAHGWAGCGPTTEMNDFDYHRDGLWWSNTTDGGLYRSNGTGWVKAWAPATAAGSVVPTAGTGVTLSSNVLHTRNGRLLGTIDWAKASLAHGDVLLTLPVGARPSFDCSVNVVSAPSAAVLHQLSVTTAGAVTAISPPAGRTSGTIRFDMPIPY